MIRLFLFAALLSSAAHAACPAAPPPPEQTEAIAVQMGETKWITVVPGWVPAPAPACWVLGQVQLEYPRHVAPELPNVQDPGPWVAGIDFPIDAPCPAEALAGCYWPPLVTPVAAP